MRLKKCSWSWAALVTVIFLVTRGEAWAQPSPSPRDNPLAEIVEALAKEVHQLRLEVANLRVDIHQPRLQSLERDLQVTEQKRRLAESEEAACREKILDAEDQLARQDLDLAERQELAAIRDALVSSDQPEVRRRRAEITDRAASLRKQWETEPESADQARRMQQALLKSH